MSRRLHPSVAGAQPFQLADRDPDAPLFETEEDLDRVEAILSRYPTKPDEEGGTSSPPELRPRAARLDFHR
jgi:hypothetical protein